MSEWNAIVSAALVGTGRTKPPQLANEIGEQLRAFVAEDAESALLAAAGSMDLWNRAGIMSAKASLDSSAAEPELLPEASGPASTYLANALTSRDEPLVLEWLELCERAGKIAAPQLLPALLDFAARKPAHSALAGRVAGNRGAWLMAKNPTWLGASVVPEWEAWETAPKKERFALFAGLRAADATRARDALAAAWPTEPANVRAELLGQMRVGLTMSDEPFLETALDDRSREVRLAAIELLTRLPESLLVARMAARSSGILVLEKRKLAVTPPESIPPDMARDGVEFKVNIGTIKLGEKALALLHIVAATPPARWAEQLALKPAAILDLAAATDWADALVTGIAWATARFGSEEWAEALFAFGVHTRPLPFPLRDLAAVLPESQRARVIEAMLRAQRVGNPVVDLAELLDCFARFWPELLANAVLEVLRRATASSMYEYRLAMAMRACLDRIPLQLAEAATLGWPEEGEWRNTLAPLVERLHTRAAMREAISR